MEAAAINNNKLIIPPPSSIDNHFDRINSPQYLSFNDLIPEAQDSYFDRKRADPPAEQQNSFHLQQLPKDSGNHSIRKSLKVPKIEEPGPDADESNKTDQSASTNSGDDLISSVASLQVNLASDEPKKLVTSTPFRVKGVEPMPWRSPSTDDGKYCTVPKPFSFEERNKQLLQRKARRIQMILQAEKEARKFRANPLPKFLRQTSNNNNSCGATSLHSQKQTSKSTDSQLQSSAPAHFKAKSPSVLWKPPFRPILPKQPLLPPKPFVLSSELRAKDRKAFDECIKEKERLDEQLRALREAAQKKREAEEIAKLRKKLVIKAQPIRKFKSMVTTPVKKRPLTEPSTPIVVKRRCR